MKKMTILFVAIVTCSTMKSIAKPIKCFSSADTTTALLHISETISKSYTQRKCLKHDESVPGCNDYYAYSCPCVQFGNLETVNYTYWSVRGEIRTSNLILPLSEFRMNLKGNAAVGEKTIFSGTRVTDPKYQIKLYKNLKANSPLVATVGFYPSSRYGELGTIVQLACGYY